MWVQHSLPHDEVRFPVTLEHRAEGLLHRHLPCLVLGGQAEEAAEHLLVLGQLEDGVGGEAGLEVYIGGLVWSRWKPLALSKGWMLLGLKALRHCLLSADHQLKLWQNGTSGQCWRLGLSSALHSSETGFQAYSQHIRAVEERQETIRPDT